MRMQVWYIGEGDERRTTLARTRKEAATLLGVSVYALDKFGGVTEDNGRKPSTDAPSPDVEVARPDDVVTTAEDVPAPPPPPPPSRRRKPAGRTGGIGQGDPDLPPTAPVRIVTTEAEVAKLNLDTWDGIINLESWQGFKNGDAVRFDGQPRGTFKFRRYYKSATQEYVELVGRNGVRPVRPETVHKIEPVGRGKKGKS